MHNKVLPKVYHFIDNLNIENIYHFNKNICIIYRNYDSKTSIEKLLGFKKYCNKFKHKFLISNEIDLAFKLKLDGVYLPSFNKKFYHKKFQYFKNFLIIGSAHSLEEIKIKERQNVEQIFLSPLFKTKKSSRFLGIMKFNNLSKFTKKPLIALGGINESNIKQLKLINGEGFAGITYFKKYFK
jgi:thiamine-phosphate pyrophosphorylase